MHILPGMQAKILQPWFAAAPIRTTVLFEYKEGCLRMCFNFAIAGAVLPAGVCVPGVSAAACV
jgi:hypothetical protein